MEKRVITCVWVNFKHSTFASIRPTRSASRLSSDAGNELGIAYMLVHIEDRNCYQGWVSRWAYILHV
jgi:hypothetical protein